MQLVRLELEIRCSIRLSYGRRKREYLALESEKSSANANADRMDVRAPEGLC